MLKGKSLVAAAAALFVLTCSTSAATPEQLLWHNLINHAERWPATTKISVDFTLDDTTLYRGTEVSVLQVVGPNAQLVAPQGSIFTVLPDECTLLDDANAIWSLLTPAQKNLDWREIVEDNTLWPDRVTLTADQEFDKVVLKAGEDVDLISIAGRAVLIMHHKLEGPLRIRWTDTDVFARARELVELPEDTRPGTIPAILAQRTVDDEGKPVTLEPAKYYVIYYASSVCPRCKIFSPELVDYYNTNLADRKDVKFIVWSTEHNMSRIQRYMKEQGMPWTALTEKSARVVTSAYREAAARFEIPGIQVIDRFGNELLATNKIPGRPIPAAETALTKLNEVLHVK